MPFVDEHRWFAIAEARREEPTPAVFLDRDGVVIEEKIYLHDPDEVELCPGAVERLNALREIEVPVILVTNQSGIGQGLFGWADYLRVHQRLIELIGIDAPFAAVYANSHHPREGAAPWRKPNPGMLLQAAADLNLRLDRSVMVGDKAVDLEAARRAGIARLVHVHTGHGPAERPKVAMQFAGAQMIDSIAELDIAPFHGTMPRRRRFARGERTASDV